MAEQQRQEPWAVKVSGEAFLDGAPGAIQPVSGLLDTSTTEAKRAKVRLEVRSAGMAVHYEATKSVGGKAPTTTPRCRVFPWPQVRWYDMPADAQSSQQNSGK